MRLGPAYMGIQKGCGSYTMGDCFKINVLSMDVFGVWYINIVIHIDKTPS